MIPGIPQADSQRLLELIRSHPQVQKVVLYGSRALGRQRACDRMGLKSISTEQGRQITDRMPR